jgi:hypothetical protein
VSPLNLFPATACLGVVAATTLIASNLAADQSAAPPVAVVVGQDAPQLERFAADEVCRYLDLLFGLGCQPTTSAPSECEALILVGSPDTTPPIRQAVADAPFPSLTDQGILLGRATLHERPALIVAGGSPRATLWAAYELVQRWGARFLLHGDALPEKRSFSLPDLDVVMEPALRVRQWRVVNDFACGPESWGMQDYRPVLDQLAKLKFNRIFISIYPWQPFLRFEASGVERQSAALWYNFHYPITDDMPGRTLFGDAEEFWNPDLPRDASFDDFAAAGERLLHNLMDYAHQRGMECVLVATLTEFPPEFAPRLKDAQKVHQLGEMTIVPGANTPVEDPALTELATAVLRATVNTYPEADYTALGCPEFRQWAGQYERAWQALDAKYGVRKARSLAEVIAAAEQRTDYPGGAERAVMEAKGDIVALYFYDRLLTDLRVLEGTRHPDVGLMFTAFAEELFPVLPLVLPPGSETLSLVDYTPSRIVHRRHVLKNLPASKTPASLIFTLHDDNVGLLPQLETGPLHELTMDLRRYRWAGFSTRYWLISDHDPCVAYLAKAAWDSAATPQDVYRDQVRATCGEACVEDMLTVFGEVENTTTALEWHALGLTFPVPGMIMSQWTPSPMPAELVEDRAGYQRALDAALRARTKIAPADEAYVDYWIGRLRFGIGYLDTIEAVRAAATAEAAHNAPEALRHAQRALALARQALEAYAGVARDQSDRGALATMAEYVYRPLKAKARELEQQQTSPPYGGFEPPDYSKYPAGLAGFPGMDLHQIALWTRQPATRSRIGWRGLYKTGLTRLPNGDLLVCPCFQADDGKYRMVIFRSTDEGKTWSQVETKGDELLGKEPALACLRDGTVLLVTSHPHGFRVSRSEDGGVTWKTTAIGQVSDALNWGPGYAMIRNVLESEDGTLTLLMSKGTYYNLSAPPSRAWLFRSRDGGRTWTEDQKVKVWAAPESMFEEGCVVRLPDGHLLATGRVGGDRPIGDTLPPRGLPTPEGDESGDHMILAESYDDGLTWTEPRPFLTYSEVHAHLLRLRDGRLLCTYASYHLPYGVFAILSSDQGKTWDTEHPIMLALSMNCYTGWPTSLQLPNGDLLTAYAIAAYLEGEGVSALRPGKGDSAAEAVRWHLPPP